MNLKSIIKKISVVIAGAISGYIIYYYVFMELAIMFVGGGTMVYPIVSMLCLAGCIIGCIIIFSLIIYKEIDRRLFILICVAYFCLLFFILYGRRTLEMGFVINPLQGLRDLSNWEMLSQSIMNILAFIPLGYFFTKIEKKKKFVMMFLIPIFLETVQALTYRGLFDTFDIILYILGIFIGQFIFSKLNLKIK